MRLDVIVARPPVNSAGDVAGWPLSELLPFSQLTASVMMVELSLRRVMSRSLLSICTGTLNVSLVTPG